MCSIYEPVTDNDQLLASFGVMLPEGVDPAPGARAMVPFIVRAEVKSPGALGNARLGLAGLLPRFATDLAFSKQTYHCRAETMKSKPAFRESWWAARRCVIPVKVISQWSTGSDRPEMWLIKRADEEPMGLAGLWNEWTSPEGQQVASFSMLTIAADGHDVFGRMNAGEDDKCMPVILPIGAQEPWLYGSLKDAERLLVRYPAEQLQAAPQEPSAKAPREPKSWTAVPDMFAPEWHVLAAERPRKKPVRALRAVPPRLSELPGPTTGDLF